MADTNKMVLHDLSSLFFMDNKPTEPRKICYYSGKEGKNNEERLTIFWKIMLS